MCCKLNLFLNLPCCSLHFIAGKTYLERVSSWQLQRKAGNFCFWYNKIFKFLGVLGNDLSITILMSQLKFYWMSGRESHSRGIFSDVKMGHLLVILGENKSMFSPYAGLRMRPDNFFVTPVSMQFTVFVSFCISTSFSSILCLRIGMLMAENGHHRSSL